MNVVHDAVTASSVTQARSILWNMSFQNIAIASDYVISISHCAGMFFFFFMEYFVPIKLLNSTAPSNRRIVPSPVPPSPLLILFCSSWSKRGGFTRILLQTHTRICRISGSRYVMNMLGELSKYFAGCYFLGVQYRAMRNTCPNSLPFPFHVVKGWPSTPTFSDDAGLAQKRGQIVKRTRVHLR